MSCFLLPHDDPSLRVIVGWDEGAAGFYVQCFREQARHELITAVDRLRCLDDLDAALRAISPALELPSMLDLYLFTEQVGDDRELRRLEHLVASYRVERVGTR